jgi:hypothetical protein
MLTNYRSIWVLLGSAWLIALLNFAHERGSFFIPTFFGDFDLSVSGHRYCSQGLAAN